MQIFDRTMSLLEKVMDLRGTRHQVIAANIANEETPGYRAKELRFLDELSRIVRTRSEHEPMVTHVRHLGGAGQDERALLQVKGQLVDLPATDFPLDANSVNLELELAKLSDNAMKYNSAAAIIAIRYRQLLAAIREIR